MLGLGVFVIMAFWSDIGFLFWCCLCDLWPTEVNALQYKVWKDHVTENANAKGISRYFLPYLGSRLS